MEYIGTQRNLPHRPVPAPAQPKADAELRRYAACPADMQAWAETAGYENLKARIASGEAIHAQAAATLVLVLAGMVGAMAFAVKVFEPNPAPTVVAAAVACVWLMLIASLLVLKCINTDKAPMLYNEPANLLIEGHTLADVRVGELLNLQERIEQQTRRNRERAAWLNRCRKLAIGSPAVLAAVMAYLMR
jgi:hypothetical protein